MYYYMQKTVRARHRANTESTAREKRGHACVRLFVRSCVRVYITDAFRRTRTRAQRHCARNGGNMIISTGTSFQRGIRASTARVREVRYVCVFVCVYVRTCRVAGCFLHVRPHCARAQRTEHRAINAPRHQTRRVRASDCDVCDPPAARRR